MASILRHHRAQGPLSLGNINLMSLVLAVAGTIVIVNWINSTMLESNADTGQKEQLQKLVDEIQVACSSNVPRSPSITVYPKRGFVFLRDITPEIKQKISGTGCEQYCLCAIKRTAGWFKMEREEEGYFSAAYFTGDEKIKEELKQMIGDEKTTIIACSDLKRVARRSDGRQCVDDITLLFDDEDESCQKSPNYWGFPVFRDYTGGYLECGGSMATLEACSSTEKITIIRNPPKGGMSELTIAPGAYWAKMVEPECKGR